jgi:hypothetical protein
MSNGGNALQTFDATANSCLDVDGTLYRGVHMAQADIETAAIYEALRDDLISLLLEHRSRGRFTRTADDSDQARSLFLIELTRSIADILVTAYPTKNARAYASALADAGAIASSILDRGLLTSR